MRIGVDARELCGRPTGVGRYLRGLLREWAESARAHEFVLYAHAPIDVALDTRRFATRLVPGRGGTFWEQWRLPRAIASDHLDVLFSPAYAAPLASAVPTVVAMHDLSFLAHPEWFRTREGMRRRWLARRTAARARAIVTISESSRREIAERLGVADERLHVVPPGIDPPAVSGREQPAAPRVLFVGSIFNRRHVPDLIRAFAQVAEAHPDAQMDLVGDNRSYPRENVRGAIEATGVADRIRWHEYVSEEELAALYGRATAFAFLSEYEGLGLTPLEALAVGIPAVLLDTPIARESCGDAALFVPPRDIGATARALDQVLFDAATRQRLLAAAPGVVGRYDWPRAAERTLAILVAAGGGS
jgi:glycosyltransferase involved in cell wall biosynthesis